MQKSYFITFEGPDGSGKSTIIRMLYNHLIENGFDVVLTREPGGSELAEKIRAIILDPNNLNIAPSTEALLYAASRAQHFVEIIEPALKANKIVLCDRFIDSSIVYQGVARNLGIQKIIDINRFAINDVMPDLTMFFDVEPEIGLARIKKSELREINRLDLEGIQFHKKVYQGYLELANNDKKRVKSIDASVDIASVFKNTLKIFEEQYYG